MEPKVFNNVIIGQFVLTGVPVKVYIGGRYLTITDADDVEDPLIGFGMDEDGAMHQFSYPEVEFLQVQGNKVDIETYNKGMEAKFKGGEDDADKGGEDDEQAKADAEAAKELEKKESFMKLGDLLKEMGIIATKGAIKKKKTTQQKKI